MKSIALAVFWIVYDCRRDATRRVTGCHVLTGSHRDGGAQLRP